MFEWGVTSVFSDMPDSDAAGQHGLTIQPALPTARPATARGIGIISVKPLNPIRHIRAGGPAARGRRQGHLGVQRRKLRGLGAPGGVGTFCGVNADSYAEDGQRIPQIYHGRTRRERHEELVAYAVAGGIQQARSRPRAPDGEGRIHMNMLWEMAAAERIITECWRRARASSTASPAAPACPIRWPTSAPGLACTITRSSPRRAPSGVVEARLSHASALLGGVVYEDPWLAGGHNGLSNSEDPTRPETPIRGFALRKLMRDFGLDKTPIFMAGGVWWLRRMGRTGSTIPSSARSPSSSAPGRC